MEALAEIASQLGIDNSFYYLFALITVYFFLFGRVFARPHQHLLENRKDQTEGVKKEALKLVAQAEEKFNQYREKIKKVHDEAKSRIRDAEEVARKEESKLLSEAGIKSKASLQATQKNLDEQRKVTVEALAGQINGLASEITTKVMGR